ncbi:hypothetical protein F383_07409 [Gossypium arboreum]|uniref:Uncharacterized protein n=1 Tax=Gossypium arboreum TaxID=29729 RepID=A0A0B0PIP4_GOSAR|nr:hypothetical protein F383_07409 [Gossypium arboreum]
MWLVRCDYHRSTSIAPRTSNLLRLLHSENPFELLSKSVGSKPMHLLQLVKTLLKNMFNCFHTIMGVGIVRRVHQPPVV